MDQGFRHDKRSLRRTSNCRLRPVLAGRFESDRRTAIRPRFTEYIRPEPKLWLELAAYQWAAVFFIPALVFLWLHNWHARVTPPPRACLSR